VLDSVGIDGSGRTMERVLRVAMICSCVLWACVARAHHSFGSIYDSTRSITLEGVVSEFLFVHPHPFLVIDVDRGREGRQSWRAEMDNRFELDAIGINGATFKPGDRVTVSGSPGRNQSQTLYMWSLERPADGLRYEQVGSTPRIAYPKRSK
jgi:hypothetical protein